MPIYTYECKDCGEKFDFLVGVVASKEEPKCKKCGSKNIERTLASFSVRVSGSSSSTSSGPSCPTGTCPTGF
ncbi:zinc ribbon domain-containing protein [bacterium]|nr:zinc ribbon domain-containing protein [bacterium]